MIEDIIVDRNLLKPKQLENKAKGKLRQSELDKIKKEIKKCRSLTKLLQD